MRIGLVLGAGGATAWAFHAGVLRTLVDEAGIDPGSADVIVGTSAGSSMAAVLRAGLDVDGIVDAVMRPPTPEERAGMLAELRSAPKSLRPLSPGLARHALPGGRGPTYALAGLLPPGWFPTGWLASLPGIGGLDPWPDGLWIPAVRATDGEVVVFGKERSDVAVHVAVEASSAVPGMFRPQIIDGVPYVDGGVASSTHADLLVDSGIDLAIVSAPMSKPSTRLFARHARRRLADEIGILRRAGIRTAAVMPEAETVKAARGFPRRNPGAGPVITGHAADATRLALATL